MKSSPASVVSRNLWTALVDVATPGDECDGEEWRHPRAPLRLRFLVVCCLWLDLVDLVSHFLTRIF